MFIENISMIKILGNVDFIKGYNQRWKGYLYDLIFSLNIKKLILINRMRDYVRLYLTYKRILSSI